MNMTIVIIKYTKGDECEMDLGVDEIFDVIAVVDDRGLASVPAGPAAFLCLIPTSNECPNMLLDGI
jgi:hypothetical protein